VSDTALRELADDPSSRKRFLKLLGSAGAVSTFGVLLAACGGDDDDSAGSVATTDESASGGTSSGGSAAGDLKIVNYALTLEYLEADFYAQVVEAKVLKGAQQELAKQFGETEQEHVDALKGVAKKLGGPAVKKPKTAFEDVLAGGAEKILATAATVENLGAAAYLGQAPNIQSKEILASALAIHSVEARHAAALNQLIGKGFQGSNAFEGSIPDGPFGKPASMDQVLKAAKPFIAG
jgi:rubrerythrin